jgi:hypothetical protein
MSKKQLEPTDNYEVGYGKPPKQTQFIKGQSGNPKGRPKGAKNKVSNNQLEKIVTSEVFRTIKVNDENGPTDMPMMQAAMRSMCVKAAKGDHRSQKLMIEMIRAVKADDDPDEDELPIINIHFE